MNKDNKGLAPTRSKSYFMYFFIVLVFVQILDTFTTHFLNAISSRIIDDFLSGYPVNVANSTMAFCIGIATIGTYVVFFNQFFADKIGRKILIVITIFGMAISSLFIALSTDIVQYTISLFFLYFFFSSDIWAIYINEESPQNKRGFWTNMLHLGGVAGALVIPIFRAIFVSETSSNWRGMTYFPIILGFILGFVVLFTIKETKKYQEMKDEKPTLEATWTLFKYNLNNLFKKHSSRKEIFVVIIISLISGLNYTFISLGETYASNSPYLNQNDINVIITVTSLSVFIGYFLTGLVIDKFGRRPLIYIYAILLPVAVLLFIYGCNLPEYTLLVVCIGGGLVYAVFWGMVVVMRIVIIEITPTEARGTGSGFRALSFALGVTFGLLLGSLITLNYGLAMTFIVFSFLPILIDIPLNFFVLKETKDLQLKNVFSK